MEVLNLQKGDLLNLSKDYKKLNSIDLGLGWDVSTDGRSWDLDVSAIVIGDDGNLFETVYYGKLNGTGIKLNGDNLTGKGDGDDEIITVKLDKLPEEIKAIGFFVNIFSAGGRDFSNVKNAYIRMVNNDTHDEVCRYKLNENGKGYNAFHFANLEKINGEWEFKAIGDGTNGSISQLKEYFIKRMDTLPSTTVNNTSSTSNPETSVKKNFFARLFGK